MEIVLAEASDAREILELQKLCYQSEAALNDDDSIPPLRQTLESMTEEFEKKVVLKAVERVVKTAEQERIIGSVRAFVDGDTCYVGRLIVHPDFQNRGIGKKLMGSVESIFLSARRFELFTGEKSAKNIALYASIGYREFKREPLSPNVMLVYMEKVVY